MKIGRRCEKRGRTLVRVRPGSDIAVNWFDCGPKLEAFFGYAVEVRLYDIKLKKWMWIGHTVGVVETLQYAKVEAAEIAKLLAPAELIVINKNGPHLQRQAHVRG